MKSAEAPELPDTHPPLSARVAAFLRHHPPGPRLGIGYSGGLDSSVLLHLLSLLRGEFSYHLFAIHVHHGLSPAADAWAEHCRRQCRDLNVPLQVEHVTVARAGQGLEAAARAARYQVFAGLEVDALALAQHRDDQAETLLLQLLRGAGMKGLAAMPEERPLAALKLLRPLLDVPRAQIEAHARAHGLSWVDDESNLDTLLRRNATRHHLLPVLEQCFPGAAPTLARAAGQFAETAELLDDLARLDGADTTGPLSVAHLAALPAARARNVLRRYLELHGVAIRRERLHEAMAQMLAAAGDAEPLVEFDGAALRRFQGRVMLVKTAPPGPVRAWQWRGEAELDLGGAGHLEFRETLGAGTRLAGNVTITLRHGGEKLRPTAAGPARTLKNLLREAGVPPWQRECLPLVHVDGRLAWAAAVGSDASFRVGAGAAGWLISWRAPV